MVTVGAEEGAGRAGEGGEPMRRIGHGLAGVISAVALTAGCASGATTTAQAPGAAATASTATGSSSGSPRPVETSATGQAVPDGYDAARNAKADIDAALVAAAKEHQEVLIDFGANWCPDCRALDMMFRSSQVAPLLKDFVVVAVDVGQFDHNVDLAGQYVNLRTSGIPALAVLKSDGTLRTATNDGSFSDARTMDPSQVSAFLTRWAPGASQ